MQPDGKLREIRVGLIGCGVVGGGLVKLLARHAGQLAANGLAFRVTHVAVRDTAKSRGVDLSGARVCANPMDVAANPDIDMLVEVMGGNDIAVNAACAALARGIPLVTANKHALARSLPRYLEAAGGRVPIGFEAAVAAHIPIIEVLEHSLGCEDLTLVKGVINGSTNYILTFMERAGCEYDAALADAAAKGFTEADPTLDVEGFDAAEKLSLLALKAFGTPVALERMHIEGVTNIRQVDIRLALELEHRIKLVAAARRVDGGLSLRVHPALVHRGELLADVDSEFNAIILEGPGFNQLTFLGKGAGELPTASAVLNDMVKIARGGTGQLPGIHRGPALPLADTGNLRLCYFLRMRAEAADSSALVGSLEGMGLKVLSIARTTLDETNYLGVITDVVEESRMVGMLPGIRALPQVKGDLALLRLDKDNYRDIVEREQSAYFGASLKRQPGPRI